MNDIFEDKIVEIDTISDKKVKSGLYKMEMKRKYIYLYIRNRKTPIKLEATHLLAVKFNNLNWQWFDDYIQINYNLESGNKFHDKKYDDPKKFDKELKEKKKTQIVNIDEQILKNFKKLSEIEKTKNTYRYSEEDMKNISAGKLKNDLKIMKEDLKTIKKIYNDTFKQLSKKDYKQLTNKGTEFLLNLDKQYQNAIKNLELNIAKAERKIKEVEELKKTFKPSRRKKDEFSGKIKNLVRILEDSFKKSNHKTKPDEFSNYVYQTTLTLNNGIFTELKKLLDKRPFNGTKEKAIKWGIKIYLKHIPLNNKSQFLNAYDDEFYIFMIKTPVNKYVYTKYIYNGKNSINNISFDDMAKFTFNKANIKNIIFTTDIQEYDNTKNLEELLSYIK